MEYMTTRLIDQMYEEISTETIGLFGSHALIKAQAKVYVRETQIRLMLIPAAQRLIESVGRKGFEKMLKGMLALLREAPSGKISYAAGNLLNLLVQLQYDLSGYDFSDTLVGQLARA